MDADVLYHPDMLRRLVEDLALPVRIVPGTLVRSAEGLALSSRNAYLSDEQKRRALTLSGALRAMVRAHHEAGVADVAELLALAEAHIDCDRLDYLHVMDAQSLQPIDHIGERPARALVAAWYGSTRLIDNLAIGPELSWT